jgi:hypothetical protein
MAKKIPEKKVKPTAKGKLRRTRIEEDEEALAAFEKEQTKIVKAQGRDGMRSDEIPTKEVVQIWADELEEIYHEFGSRLDRVNAEDKAKTLLIELRAHTPSVRITDHEYDVPNCGKHTKGD